MGLIGSTNLAQGVLGNCEVFVAAVVEPKCDANGGVIVQEVSVLQSGRVDGVAAKGVKGNFKVVLAAKLLLSLNGREGHGNHGEGEHQFFHD